MSLIRYLNKAATREFENTQKSAPHTRKCSNVFENSHIKNIKKKTVFELGDQEDIIEQEMFENRKLNKVRKNGG